MNKADLLRGILFRNKGAIGGVLIISALLNVLLLAGSIYMMLVYDSALPSHSLPTLFGLFALVTLVYLFQGACDILRSRMLIDIAATFDQRLTGAVHRAMTLLAQSGRTSSETMTPVNDVDQIRNFLSGPGPLGLIDLPWIVFFLAILSILHIWLGVTVLIGAIILALMTFLMDGVTNRRVAAITTVTGRRRAMIEGHRRHIDVIRALGMTQRMRGKWVDAGNHYLDMQGRMLAPMTTAQGVSRVSRQFLQSLVLTVGALLVIGQQATPGVIFASSILSARALAPLDQLIGSWRNFVGARQSWHRLNQIFNAMPAERRNDTQLPAPTQRIELRSVAVTVPGTRVAVVQNASFAAAAGAGIAVIGPSGSGKSSLIKGLVGIWPIAAGEFRLDGATPDQWTADELGRHTGYLPQDVDLLEGTVAENISRFDGAGDSAAVVRAAKLAGVHEMILQLPQGYDTPLGTDGLSLSGGQRQRVGLARAMYGDPFLLALDEPNSHLDGEGEAALVKAILEVRGRGGIVLVVTHRPTLLGAVDTMLVMGNGQPQMYGPRDEVMARMSGKERIAEHPQPPAANEAQASGDEKASA